MPLHKAFTTTAEMESHTEALVMMDLELKRFQYEHYAEYASWFADPELNRYLGPMDQAWLEAVLSQPEPAGVTWAVFRGNEMIAVVETVFDPERRLPAGITAIALKPGMRRQGMGTKVLGQILAYHKSQDIVEHVAYVSVHNAGGRGCLEKAGFVPVISEPDENGYLAFRYPP